jgi:cholesterol transport system auxiliary component
MILALSASLSACVSVLPDPAPAPSVYRLASNSNTVAAAAHAEIVRIDRPSSTQIFNSSDIVVTEDDQKLSAVAQAKWSETTPIMIQNAMIDALEGSSQFVGLVPTSGARTETRLHLDIKNFEANFDNGLESAPLAIVDYRVTYARADDRKLLGTHSVRKTVRAQSINVSSIVAAIEDANDAAMLDIVSWLESQKGRRAS